MLVLSRQRDETIMIGDEVEITVVDIRGDKVRLGITAPRHIQVHRKEVYEAIKRENQQAAGLKPKDVSDVLGHEDFAPPSGRDERSQASDGEAPSGERPENDRNHRTR
ncbi:MAG: carbon storage regulator CsrA [Planctomycetota bacterium]